MKIKKVKIKSITPVHNQDVYDLTVHDNHNFIGNDILVHNCGEIPLPPGDSCRLLSVNLYSYVKNPFTKDADFDYDLFMKHTAYAHRIMDDIVDLEIEKVESIINKIKSDNEPDEFKEIELKLWDRIRNKAIESRRTGIGVTAEGDMLAAMGLRYGTKKATDFATKIHQIFATEIYKSSIKLAKERGSFPIFNLEKEYDGKFKSPFLERVFELIPAEYIEMYKQTGRRNISLLTIAPTGTTSLMTGTTSGIEPVFLPYYKRRRKINPSDKDIKGKVITDDNGDSWEEYIIFHSKFLKWAKINGYNTEDIKLYSSEKLDEIVKESPYYKATSSDIDWVEKVRMQGAIQKYIDHSISVTVNLPNDATEQVVYDVYKTAWASGCKGITVYRDGSRSGVLISNDEKKENKLIAKLNERKAPRRPKTIPADIVRFQNNHESWIGFIGLIDDGPYEMFTGKLDSFPIPKNIDKGQIRKIKDNGNGSRYDFLYVDKDGYGQEMKGLDRVFDREYWNLAKTFSGLLRHGMPIVSVYELINTLKFDGDGFSTWQSGFKRMVKNYIKDGTEAHGEICPTCGSEHIVYTEGCLTCKSCGYSKCSS